MKLSQITEGGRFRDPESEQDFHSPAYHDSTVTFNDALSDWLTGYLSQLSSDDFWSTIVGNVENDVKNVSDVSKALKDMVLPFDNSHRVDGDVNLIKQYEGLNDRANDIVEKLESDVKVPLSVIFDQLKREHDMVSHHEHTLEQFIDNQNEND